MEELNMMGIKKFITCHIPVSACNFKCPYCYISQLDARNNKIIPFCISAEDFKKKFSRSVLGGSCYFNLCGNGETMLHPELIDLVDALTNEGHFVDIITNGTISKKFDELLDRLTISQCNHLFIKFSFHYTELLRTNMMEIFLENVRKIRENKISYSIEITPYDDLIPYIDKIKKFSLKEFGALPHVTVARDESTEAIELLSKMSKDEYKRVWGTFDSPLFDFKLRIFNEKRKEFCYAGEWSLEVDLASGIYKQCYWGAALGNIKDTDPLRFLPCGKCPMPHCFNGHAFLAYGDIPELEGPTYCDERDRVMSNGEHWLQKECREFFSTRLYENNTQLSEEDQTKAMKETNALLKKQKIYNKLYHIYKMVKEHV